MKRVYFNEEKEKFLAYTTLEQYAQQCVAFVLPKDLFILLQHMTAFMHFVEALVEKRTPEQEKEEVSLSDLLMAMMRQDEEELAEPDPQQISLNKMLSVAWQWHMTINEMREDFTGLYARNVLLSWTAFCKLFFLVRRCDDEVYGALRQFRAEDYPFCMMVSRDENVTISSRPILAYSVKEVRNSVRLIMASLYRYPYTTAMKNYFYALFYRYCDLFTLQQTDLKRVLDNPLYFSLIELDEEQQHEEDDEDYDAYKRITVPLDAQYQLKSEYFYEGELLFARQLRRMMLSNQLIQQSEANPIILTNPINDEKMRQCGVAMMETFRQLTIHKELKKFINEDFKRDLLKLYMFHGETERFVRQWPSSASEPGDVLAITRPSDLLRANQVQKMNLTDILNAGDAYANEIVFITKCINHRWISYESNESSHRIDAAFMIEQLVTLDDIDEAIDQEAGLPILLSLIQTYYVVYRGGVYRTVVFIEAFMIWLSILIKKERVMTEKTVHQNIREYLVYFETF